MSILGILYKSLAATHGQNPVEKRHICPILIAKCFSLFHNLHSRYHIVSILWPNLGRIS